MDTYEHAIEIDATQEVAAAVLKAAGAVMKAHGNSPNGGAIIAAGFAQALRSIGKHIDPSIPIVVREMLKASTT